MNYKVSLIDKNISEKDFKQCCDLLLRQMNFINSKSDVESVNKGVSTQIVKYIDEWCKMGKFTGISLISDVDNDIAQSLYQKFEFEAEEVLLFEKIY